jgi:hypothetical protein
MELVIEGLDKLRHYTHHGRKIGNIHIDTRGRYSIAKSYVFTFPPIGNGLEGWDKELEVYLCKYPTPNEQYELFVMGLHGVTCDYLELKQIRDIDIFQAHIISVMNRAKTYWETL